MIKYYAYLGYNQRAETPLGLPQQAAQQTAQPAGMDWTYVVMHNT